MSDIKKRLMALQQQRADALAKMRAALDKAEDNGGEMGEEAKAEYDKLKAEVASLDTRIEAQKELEALEAKAEPISTATPESGKPPAITGTDMREEDPKMGFETLGEYAQCVYKAGVKGQGHYIDERLHIEPKVPGAAPTTYSNESSGQDGGYAIPPEFQNTIRQHTLDDVNFVNMTDNNPVTGNGMAFPTDETTP